LKRLSIKRHADEDISSTIEFLRARSHDVAESFVDAVASAIDRIGRSPRLGRTAFPQTVEIEGLRYVTLARHPYSVFYVDLPDEIVVLRILHHRRDVEQLLDPDFELDA
jgi:plasmid stabilization system protein ParE